MPSPVEQLRKAYHKACFISNAAAHNLFSPAKFFVLMKVLPYTMVEYKGVANAYDIAQTLEKDHVPGAFVECGVWKGGVAGAMAYVAEKAGSLRKVWLFDSFEGLPEPTKEDGKRAKAYSGEKDSGQLISIEKCIGPLEDVQKLFFSVLKLNPEHIRISKGWFQDTLKKEKQRVGPIALLRLDGDWYESTKCALENLYDSVVHGGYVLIDDYGHWEGCKKAVDEFLASRGIKVHLKNIDYASVYFQKS